MTDLCEFISTLEDQSVAFVAESMIEFLGLWNKPMNLAKKEP